MKFHWQHVVTFALSLLITGQAHAWHAEAGVESLNVVLSGPGLGYLSDSWPGNSGYVRRIGIANGIPQDDANHHTYALNITDTESIQDTQGGASYFIGNVSSFSDPQTNNITFSLGRVNAKAIGTTYNHASAELVTSFDFAIVGTPAAGSTITVTPTLVLDEFIEQVPPNAEAMRYSRITTYKKINGEISIIEQEAAIQTSTGDPLALSEFSFDLANHVGDGYFGIGIGITAEAKVIGVPAPGSLALLTIGGLAMTRRRRLT